MSGKSTVRLCCGKKVGGKKRTGLFPVLVDDHDIGKVAVLRELDNVLHLELGLAFYEMGVGEDIHELRSEFVHRLVWTQEKVEAPVSFSGCPSFILFCPCVYTVLCACI